MRAPPNRLDLHDSLQRGGSPPDDTSPLANSLCYELASPVHDASRSNPWRHFCKRVIPRLAQPSMLSSRRSSLTMVPISSSLLACPLPPRNALVSSHIRHRKSSPDQAQCPLLMLRALVVTRAACGHRRRGTQEATRASPVRTSGGFASKLAARSPTYGDPLHCKGALHLNDRLHSSFPAG